MGAPSSFRSGRGRDGGWVTTHQDVTEREALNAQLEQQNALLQQREEELKAQNTRFDAAMRNMSQGLCLFDAEQRVVLANGRYAEIYGLTPEQVKPGTTLRQILEARAANGVYNHIDAQKFVDTKVSPDFAMRYRRSCACPTAARSRSCAGRCPTAAWSARTRMSRCART